MKKKMKDQRGFTLIEIIAVLVILGILAVVAIPKYLSTMDEARNKAAQGQIGEVKGRLSQALATYMLKNNGAKPADGGVLITEANTLKPNSCPTSETTEGDFTFKCAAGSGQVVKISVTKVQGNALSPVQDGNFTFSD